MDKNTWIGFGLIALILVGFSLFNRPSKEELERRQHYQDSLRHARQVEIETEAALRAAEQRWDTLSVDEMLSDSVLVSKYGVFAASAVGETDEVILENELVRLHISNKGGVISQVELKNYRSYNDSINPLSLFSADEAKMDFAIMKTDGNLHTSEVYFVSEGVVVDNSGNQTLTMRLHADSIGYLDFIYTLPVNDYMVGMTIKHNGLQNVFAQNYTSLNLSWEQLIPQHENGRKFEERYATLQYMLSDNDIESLSESKSVSKRVNSVVRWIAYKDQFFSSVLIADTELKDMTIESEPQNKSTGYIKQYKTTNAQLAFDPQGNTPSNLRFYFGPNHYNTLKAYDKGVSSDEKLNLKKLVPLGWKIVSWINMWLVIPMFDLLMSWGLNIGLVILIMTFVIKLIILPFTFSSYRSTAKMRVLKPQLEEINAKYPPEKMQERQQATMQLYQKAGVNPMSGCLPMLFQLPVVMAMFWFFPTAIELRGQSFLWAHDLSTYDAIFTWQAHIPLISWFFGNHISLFCLLMTVTNIVYTWLNMQTQATGTDPSAKIMKWMMYLMPVFFMYIFNDYASGLSYYYFISLLFTIIQTYIFRWSIDDAKLLKQMEANAAKKAKGGQKKSGFMERLEKMQREQQKMLREQQNKKRR